MHDAIVIGAGQSGLAAAHALCAHGLTPVVLEAGTETAGSWPHYYDSLTSFSPARFSEMPGMPFAGDPDRYPHRDEVVDYLRRYATELDAEIRTETAVSSVERADGEGFVVRTADGDALTAAGLVAASGSFGNPHVPVLPGQDAFRGQQLHVADYRDPKGYAGQRVIVVGAGNSAIQVGYELAQVASVSLATRLPIVFFPQCLHGRDVHYWLTTTGFDQLPPQWLTQIIAHGFVMDTGDYENALKSGQMDRRPMFMGFDSDTIIWSDGGRETVDTIIYATGYRPNLAYLDPLGALESGAPKHSAGISTTHLGLVYVGLEFQRSFSSNTLRGVHRDAEYVLAPLAAYVRDAPTAVGL